MQKNSQEDPDRTMANDGNASTGSGPGVPIEVRLSALWKEFLGLPVDAPLGIDENFFDVGGTSLLATRLLKRLNEDFRREVPIAVFFEFATIRNFAQYLDGVPSGLAGFIGTRKSVSIATNLIGTAPAIAIIGMTGRFPGADTVEEFWQNLLAGEESITFFEHGQLDPHEQLTASQNENYVAARPLLSIPDYFDADFFGIYPKEAAQMDPQHRILLECAWEVLERAGYDPAHTTEPVGVFAGCSMNTYFLRNLADKRAFLEDFTGNYQVGNYPTMMGNDKDFLPTRISYKLNLRGPSLSVQAACSTSLVAVVQACQSLLTGGCKMALAGAVSVTFPLHRGYLSVEGGLASLDGHCRPFDERASGTVFGHGAGIVLLKRLEDAEAAGDQVLAVIRGFAVNNDGSAKAGYTAPSVEGQSEVIARAQQMAGIDADSISYVEAHGTGTPLGDPIEVAALTRAFRETTQNRNFCSLGTAKGNVGHLDVAAGATGLIKTVLQIEHKTIPALLHFRSPNRHLQLEESPFFVDQQNREWLGHGQPLRAGVSAFGVGGTNAHLVVEEPPTKRPSDSGRKEQLIIISAKTQPALEKAIRAFAEHFAENKDSQTPHGFADAAFTLQTGRSSFRLRRAVVASSAAEATATLTANKPAKLGEVFDKPQVVFCFPGQGIQTVGMGRQLYDTESVFRESFDHCDSLFHPLLGKSLLSINFAEEDSLSAAAELNQTLFAQPAIFAFEYSLARLWQSWGIHPAAMLGHSVGEYVAACLAGVLSLEDAVQLLAARSRLMQSLPTGAMLAVRAPEERVLTLLQQAASTLDLAAVNSPQLCVVSGEEAEVESFMLRLEKDKVAHRRLVTSHAFHSRMLDPILEEFAGLLKKINFQSPTVPYVSSLTGNWIVGKDVRTPAYWVNHLRQPVRFLKAVQTVAAMPQVILLEVGPAETLVQLMRQSTGSNPDVPLILASQAALKETVSGDRALLSTLGRMWVAGVQPDWEAYHRGSRRLRRLLPTYQFDRKRHWIEPAPDIALARQDGNKISSLESQALSAQSSNPLQANHSAPSQPSEDCFMADSTQVSSTLADLKALIADLSGTDLADAEPDASFLELGFDSLFLTQLTQGIQGKYKMKLTFRQIMEDYPTLNGLAAHITDTAAPSLSVARPAPIQPPPVAQTETPVPDVASSSVTPVPSGNPGGYEALFASQVQALNSLFEQQFSLLQGRAVVASSTPPPLSANPFRAATTKVAVSSPTSPATETKAVKATFTPFKPLQKGETGGLNSVQETYLNQFIETYNRKTGKSKQFTQSHRSVFADGRVVSGFNAQLKELIYPIVVERAKGAYLWDKDGNRYIDILNGYGAILYGHSPDFLVKALQDQLELGFAIGPQTDLVGECSELIREFTGLERVTFCNTGSEAVMGAMRLARTVTGRNLVVLFSGDYHGSFDEVLVKSVGNQRSMPVAPGIPRESVANILVLDYGTDEALTVIRERADEIAAVLVEPVQSRHPELRPQAFLREVRSITEQSGSALIFDEVVTGFRTHVGGMQAVYGIKADLATYGKVIAGGMPMGVLAGSSTFMDALDGGSWRFGDESFPQVGVTFYAGTFMRHPLAMAAVRASLLHLKAAGPELQRSVAAKTAALVTDLNKTLHEFSYPSNLETFSSWFYFPVPTDPKLARMLHFHLREEGIHIQEGFPCFLTTAHTDADLNEVRAAFRKGLERMRAGQVLPGATPSSDTLASRSLATSPATKAMPTETLRPVARDFPITEQQREIFLGTQLGPEANCAFNESTSLELKGNLDLPALEAGLKVLVARHESLRSTIDAGGEIVHVSADVALQLAVEDLNHLPEAVQQRERAEFVRNEASTPFDLLLGPLFRARILKFSDQSHTLVFTAHHIIFDGWSTNVLFRELAEIYNASVRNAEASLPTPYPFSAYAEQQKRTSGSDEHATVERFWLDQFRTLPNALQIPTDRPRPQLRENSGATLRFVFPSEMLKAVRKAGAKQGSTLFATLLSSFALLIHRLAQQEDVVIGIPVAGQAQVEEGASLVGHGVNFLPIRSHLWPGQSLSQFMQQTRKTLLDAQDHQDYTYGTLLRALKIASDPSRLQLVEVQFNVEQVGSGLQMDGLAVDLSANPKSHVNMDLFFNFVDRGSELWLDVDYNTGLFEADTIARWFGHLNAILDASVADVAQPADQVSLLNTNQLDQILFGWNATEAPFDRERGIHRVFEAQVERSPDAVALVGADRTMTYAELNERSNQLARFLQNAGIRQADRVAISLHRSLELMVSLIAILKAGAAYVPVDPGYPASRLSFLFEDSGAKLLLTQRSVASQLPAELGNLLILDQEWPVIALESPQNLGEDATSRPDSLAYVMYTSGSTGNPKGVLIPHRAVLRLVQNNSFASFATDEVFLQLAPISFDAATFEIWGALLNGARLVMGPVDRVTPDEIGQLISANGVTTVWLTAALFHLVVTEHLEILRPLRQLLAGGDVLSVAHCRTVCQQLPHIRLVNGYGPTENTTFTCCHTVSQESLEGSSVPIGKAIANTRVYILDANRKPVPPGVTGELYAAGDGLALGYLNAAELTEEKFIQLTIEGARGKTRTERAYRTGDLARFRSLKSDGTVEFLGRGDNQVKIRGYRIELAEIENALERFPLVMSAVVAVRTDWVSAYDAPGDKRLAAYVIPSSAGNQGPVLIAELRKYLQEQLPDYMQPAAIMQVQSFPRTINGKVDRRALPAPVPEQLMRSRSIVYPRTPLQETLASIWSKVLGVKEVSIEDTIFELGGDSLLIFRITTMANQAGLNLTARQIFQHKTVAAICERLEAETSGNSADGHPTAIKAIPRALHRRPQAVLK